MVSYNAPCAINDIIYDNLAQAWKVNSIQFFEKNISLKCVSCEGLGNKTFLIGKKTIGTTLFIGKTAERDSRIAFKKYMEKHHNLLDTRTPDEDFADFKN